MIRIREYIRELIEQELEEMTTTGNAAGFYTPFAFQGDKEANRRKRRQSAAVSGYKVVKNDEQKSSFSLDEQFERVVAGIRETDEYGLLYRDIQKAAELLKHQGKDIAAGNVLRAAEKFYRAKDLTMLKRTKETAQMILGESPHMEWVNEAHAPEWKYTDNQGRKHLGHVQHVSDRGGTDVTYFFIDKNTGELSLLNGPRVKKQATTTGKASEPHPKFWKNRKESVNEVKKVDFRIPISGRGSRTSGGQYGKTHIYGLRWAGDVVAGTAETMGNDDDLWNDTREIIARYGWQVGEPKFLSENEAGTVSSLQKNIKNRMNEAKITGGMKVRAKGVFAKGLKDGVWYTLRPAGFDRGEPVFAFVIAGGQTVHRNTESTIMRWLRQGEAGDNNGLVRESVSEAGDPYYPWRNDESLTPRQKIGRAISEINKQLGEMHKVVKRSARLKKEMGMSANDYWKRTNNAFLKMEQRMHRISQKLREMRV